MRTYIFAGDGERTTTGAAEARTPVNADGAGGNVPDGPTASSSNSTPGGSQDYGSVRTRNDLAMLINQNIIKQEIEGPAEEEGREMDVDDGNEPVLYLGESHPGEGETDDSFDVEMEELRNSIKAGDQRGGGGEGAGAGEEMAEEQQEAREEAVGAEGHEVEQAGEGEENAGQLAPGQEVPDPDPEIVVAEPVATKPRYNPSRQYFAVKEIRASGTPCRSLNRKSNAAGEQDGGFDQEGDERWGRNWNRFDVESGRNVSASFNPITGVCGTCLTGVHPAWRGGGGGAIVLVLSDHHFPANVPVDGPGDCLRILRVENGSVNEIVDEFLRVGPRDELAEGTVIMLSSASQLGYDSVEHYWNEWKRCRNLLKKKVWRGNGAARPPADWNRNLQHHGGEGAGGRGCMVFSAGGARVEVPQEHQEGLGRHLSGQEEERGRLV
jgi:hypothetical protein